MLTPSRPWPASPRAWAWAVRAQAEPSGCRGEQALGMGTLLEGRRRLCHIRPEVEHRFPECEPPPTPRPQHRPRARPAGPRAAPAPAIGCAFGSALTLPLSGRQPHFPRASRGPALPPGAPRGAARAERRRGRSLLRGASGLVAGGRGRGQARRKQRARSRAAVPVPSSSWFRLPRSRAPVPFYLGPLRLRSPARSRAAQE